MEENELIIDKVLKKIEEVEDLLSDILPKKDKKHKEEILDICSLVRMRAEQYMNEYGVNEGVEI